ncbi:hypothetical protein EV182_004974, partial [Spiromyces aspiralis]
MYLCLYEKHGKIPLSCLEEIKELERSKYPNLCVTASKSGKLSSTHIPHFAKHCIAPYLPPLKKVDLFLDSWSGHTNPELFTGEVPDHYHCDLQLHIIPPKTTSIIQPLDVYFNIFLKKIIKKITDQ